MATIKEFEDLEVWKKSRALCKIIFEYTNTKPFANDFELKGQILKSSGSVMDNVAEGFERGSKGEFITFLGYSKGSAGEVRSQLYRAFDRNYVSEQELLESVRDIKEISKMLKGLIEYLKGSDIRGDRHKAAQL